MSSFIVDVRGSGIGSHHPRAQMSAPPNCKHHTSSFGWGQLMSNERRSIDRSVGRSGAAGFSPRCADIAVYAVLRTHDVTVPVSMAQPCGQRFTPRRRLRLWARPEYWFARCFCLGSSDGAGIDAHSRTNVAASDCFYDTKIRRTHK